MIDTGFTGFILIPEPVFIMASLTYEGTVRASLANGKQITSPTARCVVAVGGRENDGVAVVGGSDPLVGMEFLRRFRLGLFLTAPAVTLFDEDVLNQVVQRMERSREPQPS